MRTLKILIMGILFILLLPSLSKAEAYVIRAKISERILLLESENQEIKRYPIAVPTSNPYPLPLIGTLKRIEVNPVWYPTAKTRIAYLKKKGINLPAVIKSEDSRNAMGKAKFIIEFENWTEPIRIHGTNLPSSIGRRASRGCIRMYNKDILELIEIIKNSGETKIIIEK